MAAKAKTNTVSSYRAKPKIKRPGVHAKTKQSKNKNTAPSLIVDFSTGSDFKIYFNEIYFNYRKKKMNPEQLILLENYLIKIVKANLPTVYLNDFPCQIDWDIFSENGENSLNYSFITSPIKIRWDEIYT